MTVCPDEERLAAFLERRLSGAVRDEVERHVAGCAACLDVVAASLATPSARIGTPATSAPSAVDGPLAVRAAPRATRARPGRWRRLAWAAALVLATGVLLRAAAPWLPGFGPTVGRLASRGLDADVRVAAIGGRLGPSGTFVVSLRGLHWGHGGASFTVDEIEATVALAALVSGAPSFRHVRLVRPRLEVARPATLAVVASREERARVLAALDPVERVDVVDGTFVLQGDAARSEVIEGLTGSLEIEHGDARFVLQGRVGAGTLDVTGAAGGDDPLAVTVAGRNLEARIVALLADRVEGTADVRVEIVGSGDDLRVGGRIAVRGGRWLGVGLTRLLGMDATARQRLAATAPRFAGNDLVFDEARAVFARRRGTWRLSRVFVTAGEVVAGGGVRVRPDGALEGRGTVQLPPVLVDGLGPYVPPRATLRREPTGSATLPYVLAGSVNDPRVTLTAR